MQAEEGPPEEEEGDRALRALAAMDLLAANWRARADKLLG